MLNFQHGGTRWGYTFLISDSKLSEDQRFDLMYRATEMYLFAEETSRRFRDDAMGYEGYIRTKGNFDSIGGMWGQRFDAELDTEYGKICVRFLVNEQTVGVRTSASNN